MKDVSQKPDSLRVARATATLHAPAACIDLLRSGETEKGDPLKTARVAGILAAKRTDELIPLCHPLPIHRADVHYELADTFVRVIAEVQTIGPTGVEMEALTAASLAALTIYDMLSRMPSPTSCTSRIAVSNARPAASPTSGARWIRHAVPRWSCCPIRWPVAPSRIRREPTCATP